MAAADAREHFPLRIESAVDGVQGGRGVIVGDVVGEHEVSGLLSGWDTDLP